MEKIIYVKTESGKQIGSGPTDGSRERAGTEREPGRICKSAIGEKAGNMLGLSYPIYRKEGTALGLPIVEYRIEGVSEKEAAALEAEEKGSAPFPAGSGKKQQTRWNRTLKKIKKEIQKKEMQKMTGMSGDAFLFCGWRQPRYPLELMASFYKTCYKNNVFVFRAEQLIFLDGWEGEEEERLWQGFEDPELAFLWEIYTTYNYLTIVTERGDFWQEFTESAYEEYGLSVRRAKDDRKLTFREKKTLVVDLGRIGKECCGNFPPDSIYLDFRESDEKTRKISLKCGKIPRLSLRNALDTALKDTV